MAGSRLAIGQAFRVEKIGEETIVFNRSSGETIHRASGNAAEALRLIADGVDETDVPAQFRPAVDELVAAGVVEGSRVWSRRQALATGGKGIAAAGAVWTAATVSTFALADPAAAATPCSGITPSPAQVKYTTSGTYTTGRGVTTLQVRVWGGGGGGGGGRYDGTWSSGSGGGGGAYAHTANLTVTPCTAYSVVVGAGGAGGARRTYGSAGSDSYFGTAATVMAKGGYEGLYANGGHPTGGAGGAAATSVGTSKTSGGRGAKAAATSWRIQAVAEVVVPATVETVETAAITTDPGEAGRRRRSGRWWGRRWWQRQRQCARRRRRRRQWQSGGAQRRLPTGRKWCTRSGVGWLLTSVEPMGFLGSDSGVGKTR